MRRGKKICFFFFLRSDGETQNGGMANFLLLLVHFPFPRLMQRVLPKFSSFFFLEDLSKFSNSSE